MGAMESFAAETDDRNLQGFDCNLSPREPLILSVTTEKIDKHGDIPKQMIERMEVTAAYRPDLICLPEGFATTKEAPEPVPGPVTDMFSNYAGKHRCYIICPLHVRRNDRVYNSAVLLDREGEVIGVYDKIHPTERGLDAGLTPGKHPPPVFETDFGTIGIQICFDANWIDEWRSLQEQGAEIVFFPSAYPAGRALASYAWMFQYYVVGCSKRDPSPIYDMTGDLIATTGRYEHWALARLNLEKILGETDFNAERTEEIRKKYGRKVRIVYYHDEDWVTIESRSPDVTIKHLIDEFGLLRLRDYVTRAGMYQDKFR